jgi:diaminopimelate decarboxylase
MAHTMLTTDLLLDIAQRHGTPCFVYDFAKIREQVHSLNEAFAHRFAISYAMKANPNEQILSGLRKLVRFLDISSAGELERAIGAGWNPSQISFTGPAKRDVELAAAVEQRVAEVVVESVQEAVRLNAIAAHAGCSQRVLIRINPMALPNGFGVGMAGRPSQFGIDEEDADTAIERIKGLDHLQVVGLHIYAGTQCLKPTVIAHAYEQFATLFQSVSERHRLHPSKLVFGSGLGVPHHDGEEPLHLDPIAASTNPLLDRLRELPALVGCEFVLETGRYLVAEAGVYLTKVISAKRSRGTEIRICDGGINHNLAAGGHLGSVIPRNYRIVKISKGNVESHGSATAARAPFDLCGPLCTSIDLFGRAIALPELNIGDVLAIQCTGAYGLTASPTHFISHPMPPEILIDLLTLD